jgi:predicted permease
MRTRIFRALLVLLPRAFRARFADEVLDTAEALDRARPVRLREIPAVVIDAASTWHEVRHEMRTERAHVRSFQRAAPDSNSRRLVMQGLWQDIRWSARGLRRDVSFTAFVVAALTLGIGANAAMFGIVDRLLVSGPTHVREASRVVRLYLTTKPQGMRQFTTNDFGNVSYDLARHQAKSFGAVASYDVNDVTVGEGTEARKARGGFASATLFPLLGVQPAIGRFFRDDENVPNSAEHVVVLGYGAWQRWFGGATDVLGTIVTIGTERYSVIGVAPLGFTGPQLGPVDVWLPINLQGPRVAPDWQTAWNDQWLQIVGRLRPGVTMAQASDELTAILHRAYSGDEPYVGAGRMFVAGLSADDAGVEAPEITVVRWLFGVTLIVLLIACANVANLMLARGVRRSREVALRFALGARTSRLVRLLLVESMLLAIGGALGGVAVAYALGGLARRLIFSWVDWSTSPVDGGVLAASAVLAVVTGLAVGLLPAWRAVRANLTDALKESVRDGGGQRSRTRHALTIVQAALSVVLLVGAGLFVRSLWNVWTLPLGIDPERVMVAEISYRNRMPLSRIEDPAAQDIERQSRDNASLALVADLRRISGVDHASAAIGMPFGNRFTVALRVPGLATVPRLETGSPSVSAVGADYFATMGTRILRGRAFGPADRHGSEPVAIVSDTMAQTIWPGQDPIGKCVISGDEPAPCGRIVGVAESTHRSAVREPPVMHYYIPFGQERAFGGTVLLVRSSGDPLLLGPAVRRALVDRDPTIRFVDVSTVQDQIDPQTKQWRIGATVFVLSGLLALLVAAIGVYSVMSYLVADRTHEIGVRLALGARRTDVAKLILRGGVGMALVGSVLGCVAALVASRTIESLLFNESARDPWIYGGASVVIVAVAAAAGVLPTLRANRISPVLALKAE